MHHPIALVRVSQSGEREPPRSAPWTPPPSASPPRWRPGMLDSSLSSTRGVHGRVGQGSRALGERPIQGEDATQGEGGGTSRQGGAPRPFAPRPSPAPSPPRLPSPLSPPLLSLPPPSPPLSASHRRLQSQLHVANRAVCRPQLTPALSTDWCLPIWFWIAAAAFTSLLTTIFTWRLQQFCIQRGWKRVITTLSAESSSCSPSRSWSDAGQKHEMHNKVSPTSTMHLDLQVQE